MASFHCIKVGSLTSNLKWTSKAVCVPLIASTAVYSYGRRITCTHLLFTAAARDSSSSSNTSSKQRPNAVLLI
eukprot:1523588-Pleurochrysis_carterae.AAC.1